MKIFEKVSKMNIKVIQGQIIFLEPSFCRTKRAIHIIPCVLYYKIFLNKICIKNDLLVTKSGNLFNNVILVTIGQSLGDAFRFFRHFPESLPRAFFIFTQSKKVFF